MLLMPSFSSASWFALASRRRVLLAAVADEQHLDLLLERRRVGQRGVVRRDAAAAEDPDVRELVEVGQGDLPRLHAAHRQPRHGAMRLVGERAIVGVDEGDQLLGHDLREGGEVEPRAARRGPSAAGGGALAGGAGPPGRGPMPPPLSITMMNGLALPAAIRLSMIRFARPWFPHPVSSSPRAVLQVQHRIACAGVLVVIGRRVDEAAARACWCSWRSTGSGGAGRAGRP